MNTKLHRLPRLLRALAWWGAALALPASADQLKGWLFVDPEIPGESADAGHPDWLDFDALDAKGATPLEPSAIAVHRKVDKASPKLFLACATGRVFPEVQLHLSKSAGDDTRLFWTLTLKNARVASVENAGGEDGQAVEELTLVHEGLRMTYYRLTGPAEPPVTTVVPYSGDSDGDGMPDDFEALHGFNPYTDDSRLDTDGDGLTNLEEFRLGTNPRDGSSFFRAIAESGPPGSGELVLTWNSVPGADYDVKFSPNLIQPFEAIARVRAAGTTTSHTVPRAGGKGFYKVELVEP